MSTNTQAIPDDTRKAARSLAMYVFHHAVGSDDDSHSMDTDFATDAIAKAIHDAVMAERERDQWQPIETAPKDGTDILVAHYRRPGVEMVSWKGGPKKGVWHTEDKIGSYGPGFFTHWQPLPAAPKSEG